MKCTLVGCAAIVLWASSIPFGKRCSEDVGPITVVALQYAVGGMIGLSSNFLFGERKTSGLEFLWNRKFHYRCAMFALYAALLYFAIGSVSRTELPVVTLLNYIWPTATMLLSVLLLRQKCNVPLLIVGSIVALAGLSIEIVGEQLFHLFAEPQSISSVLAFISAGTAGITWGFYTVFNRSWGTEAGGAAGLPFVMLVSSAILFALRFLFHESSNFPIAVLPPLAYMLTMPYLAHLCWDVGTRRGNITLLSLLADGLPWASLTIASLYLGIAIDSKTWISAFIIVSGALISRYSLKKDPKPEDAISK